VWNRSVISYHFNYFRPGTRNLTDKLKFALIPIGDYKNDPYAIYRTVGTTSIVGVSMEVTYLVGNTPSSELTDSASKDSYVKTTYWYDLEIDNKGIIIGGEWQDVIHPDFLWVVASDYFPRTIYDYILGNRLYSYNGTRPLAENVTTQAKIAAKEGKVLFTVLEAMLKLSQNNY
jgi:hypothetical protein